MMCKGEEAIKAISPWLKDWAFSAVDVDGLSGGLLTGWSQILNPFLRLLQSPPFQ
jgi:hypothetical protein